MSTVLRHSIHGLLALSAILLSAFTGLRTVIERPSGDRGECQVAAATPAAPAADTRIEVECAAPVCEQRPALPVMDLTCVRATVIEDVDCAAPALLIKSARGPRAP